MRLTVVGCAGSYPGPNSAASCYLVEQDGFRLVLDLGNGALGPLQRATALADLGAVVLTHLHVDHCVDMTSLYVARTYDPAGAPTEPLPVHAPTGAGEQLARAYGATHPDHFLATFDVRPLVEGLPRSIGPFRLTTVRTAHPIECHALRLEAGGRSLVYTGDTGPSEAVTGLAAGADVLLAEASFVEGEPNPPGLHLSGGDAGRMAAAAGVGRLLLTHVPAWYRPQDRVAEAVREFRGPLEAVVAGQVVEV